MIDRFMNDPQANTLAIFVLAALIFGWNASLALVLKDAPNPGTKKWYIVLPSVFGLLGVPAAYDLLRTGGLALALAVVVSVVLGLAIMVPLLLVFGKPSQQWARHWYNWAPLPLMIGGLAAAGYLTYVEVTHIQPVCGPLGDCGTVQNSQYATLFGVLPVGVLGLAGYAAIFAAWLVGQFGPGALKKWSALALWGFCLFGAVFSTYLTYLEPFVIGATCMWCIISAVVMLLLLWVATPAAQQALAIEAD